MRRRYDLYTCSDASTVAVTSRVGIQLRGSLKCSQSVALSVSFQLTDVGLPVLVEAGTGNGDSDDSLPLPESVDSDDLLCHGHRIVLLQRGHDAKSLRRWCVDVGCC